MGKQPDPLIVTDGVGRQSRMPRQFANPHESPSFVTTPGKLQVRVHSKSRGCLSLNGVTEVLKSATNRLPLKLKVTSVAKFSPDRAGRRDIPSDTYARHGDSGPGWRRPRNAPAGHRNLAGKPCWRPVKKGTSLKPSGIGKVIPSQRVSSSRCHGTSFANNAVIQRTNASVRAGANSLEGRTR